LSLKLKEIKIPGSTMILYSDIMSTVTRPYVTKSIKEQVFQALHGLSHPEIKATKLIKQKYVWQTYNVTVVYGHKSVYNARKPRYSDMVTPIGNFLELMR